MKTTVLLLLSIFIFINLEAQINFEEPEYNYPFQNIGSVCIADINNDNLNDAIVCSINSLDTSGNITIFHQDIYGEINDSIVYHFPYTFGPRIVCQIGDVNNDSLNDIVFCYDDSIGIFFQNTAGTLDPLISMYSGDNVTAIKIGDVNNDSKNDIVSAHFNEDFIRIFYQDTNNTFNSLTRSSESAKSDSELEINDINSDGLNDIILMPSDYIKASFYTYLQTTSNIIEFTPTEYHFNIGSTSQFKGIEVYDFNNDGRLDILGTHYNSKIIVAFQSTSGIFSDTIHINTWGSANTINIADLNCDGNDEIIVGHSTWNFSVTEQDANGEYSSYKLFPGVNNINSYDLDIGDLNNDGRLDVLTASTHSSLNVIYNRSISNVLTSADTTLNITTNIVDTLTDAHNEYIISVTDTIDECVIKTDSVFDVHFTNVHYVYSGDTTVYCSFEMCNNMFEDTIIKEFNDNYNTYNRDTNFVNVKIDTLKTDYNYHDNYETIDTISSYNDTISYLIISQDTSIINDTTYLITDSLFVSSFIERTNKLIKKYSIYYFLKCGNISYDTIYSYEYNTNDTTIISSDTTLLSHTVSIYISIEEIENQNLFKIYPNPASNIINILDNNTKSFSISIYSISGKLLINANNKKSLDISMLPQGTYILKARNKYTLQVIKFIIKRN